MAALWRLIRRSPPHWRSSEGEHSVDATLSHNKVPFIRTSYLNQKWLSKLAHEPMLQTSPGIPKVALNNSPTASRCAADFNQTPHNRSEKAKKREIRGGGILTATSQERARRPFVHVYCSGWSTEKCWSGDAHSAPFPSLPFPSPRLYCPVQGGRSCARRQAQAGALPDWCGACTRPLLLLAKLLCYKRRVGIINE